MIYILDEDDFIVGELVNDGSQAAVYWNDEIEEKLNDAYLTFTFEMNARHPTANYIKKKAKLVTKDRDGFFLMFRIEEIEDDLDEEGSLTKIVTCEHIALELLGAPIRPITLNGVTSEQYYTYLLQNTNWKLGIVEWEGTADIVIDEYTNAIEAILKGRDYFTGELRYRVYFDGPRLAGRYIDLLQRRGNDNGVQVTYGHNMRTLKRTENFKDIYTALIGVARGSDDNYITFESITADDKPAGQDWIGDDEALQNFGIDIGDGNLQHYMGTYIYEGDSGSDVTPEQLLTATRQQLAKVSSPSYTYEATAQDLEDLTGISADEYRLGDTITIKNDDFNPPVLISARILSTKRRVNSSPDDSFTIGEYDDIYEESQLKMLKDLRQKYWRERSGLVTEEEMATPGGALLNGENIQGDTYLSYLESPNVPKYSIENINLYVSQVKQDYTGAVEPDDNNAGDGWLRPLRTIAEARRRIPDNYHGIAKINLPYNGEFSEQVIFDGISGSGKIIINGGDANYQSTYSGDIQINGCDIEFEISYLKFFAGSDVGAWRGIVHATSSPKRVWVHHCTFQGNTDTAFGACAEKRSYIETEACVFNDVNRGTAALRSSTAINRDNTGRPRNSGVYSLASDVYLVGTMPSGIDFKVDTAEGGQIHGDKVTAEGTTTTTTPPVATQDITKRWTSTGGSSWRPNFSGSWINEVAQGIWGGYGIYKGLWYFPSDMYTTLQGKTIKKVRMYVQRLGGSGIGGDVTLYFRAHNYSSQPAGQPSYLNTFYAAAFYAGEKRWITLNKDFNSLLASGARGIGVYYGSSNSNYYAKLSTQAILEVTYQ